MDTINPGDTSEQYTVHCANEACNCEVTAPMSSEAFCRESCRDAAEREESSSCSCGHPACDSP